MFFTFIKSNMATLPCARAYIDSTTEHYYWTVPDQKRIPTSKGSYDGVLNEAGKRLLKETLERVAAGKFTDTLSKVKINEEESSWTPDTKSKWHTPGMDDAEFFLHIESRATGRRLKNGVEVQTTTGYILLSDVGDRPGWILTLSGSLYRLTYA